MVKPSTDADIDFLALGDPDLAVGGLRLWVRGREFPNATDYWDGNWLDTVAYCRYPGASVWTTGAILRTDELTRFAAECESLYRTHEGEARLECMEPYLDVKLLALARGRITVSISLTPDNVNQRHQFTDAVDQSYLPDLVTSCRRLLSRFPTLGSSDT